MIQEKKKTLQVLLVGTSGVVVTWVLWLFWIIMDPDPKAFGTGMLLLLPLAVATLVVISAAIEDVKRLMKKDEEAEKTEE